MNIVVVDAAHLAGEADFPMLDLPKYGWQQFPALSGEELAERCWRSDVIITVDTPIDRSVIDKAFKLALIAVAGAHAGHVDMEAAAERGIKICVVPEADPSDAKQADRICSETIDNIAAFLRGEVRNQL
jgi:lactate dehydrogenase-like 2-hydroxyacid dehydrogenase